MIKVNTTIHYEKLSTEQLHSALATLCLWIEFYQAESKRIVDEIGRRNTTIKVGCKDGESEYKISKP